MCYNAGFVLAHEVANVLPKESKIIVLAPLGVEQELRNHGFENLDTLSKDHSATRMSNFQQIEIDKNVSAVVLGINKTFNFNKLSILSLYL
mgnify:CR=1 FL=1